MTVILKSKEVRDLVKALLVFLLISTIPAALNYIHWSQDIIHDQGRNFTFSSTVNNSEVYFSNLPDLPVSSDIVLVINRTQGVHDIPLQVTLLSESDLDDFINDQLTPFTELIFNRVNPDQESANMTFTTQSTGEQYIVYFFEEVPEEPVSFDFNYRIYVEPYFLRHGFLIVFLYSITWIVYYTAAPRITTQRRRKRLLYKIKREREQEEAEFYEKYNSGETNTQ